ncbi:Pvstp1 [Plasmodium vivax Brazil I]|uniref:Pvstp1 n=1 Tax=Plasmodium vivax (strain Brazil I) TaxID=1033975 RepID=A0A0J9SXX9_PLAV1|nr:Pvstp1 [Plasmodium vivax Brazil I]
MFNFRGLPLGSAITNSEEYEKLIAEYDPIFSEYVIDILQNDKNTKARIKCIELNYKLDEMRDKFINVVKTLSKGTDAENSWNDSVENIILKHLYVMTDNSCYRNPNYKYSAGIRKLREMIEVYCEVRDELYYKLLEQHKNKSDACKQYISWLTEKMVYYVNNYFWRIYVTQKGKIDEFKINATCDIVYMFDNNIQCKDYYSQFRHHLPYSLRKEYPPRNKFKTGQDFEIVEGTDQNGQPVTVLNSQADKSAEPLIPNQNLDDKKETIIALDIKQEYRIKLVSDDNSKPIQPNLMDPNFVRKNSSVHATKLQAADITQNVSPQTIIGSSINNINNNNSSNNSNNHSHHNHHHPFPLSVAMLLLYTSLGSLFGVKRKKRYSKRIHKIAVKPAHDKEKKKDIPYDSLDVPVRDIEYEYLIRNRDILKGLQTPKKKKSGSKTIVEIHMEVLEECKREEWELIREDFLEIVLQEFMKNESDTCESTSSNDLIGEDSHNSDEMYIQKHLWHTWEDEHKHIFDKLKEKTWFHSLKKEWKREQEGLQENELSECDQLNGEQYVPFIERQKCVWAKWVSKQRIRMEQYAEVGWFDKLIEQYQKETNHYVEKATNNTSAPKVNKTKHEADNHESCVLTKKELITKVWMLILMMVLDECKEEDDLQNRELYLDDHIGKCLKKENEETSQDISDLDRNFFERPKKKETDEYKAEMFKNLIEEAIHNKLHKNDQRDDNDVEEEDPMEKYNTDTYMLHLNDDHTNSLNGEDEESFLNGEYINPEGNYHAGSEGDTSLPSEQDQLGEIFNELKSESNELQSDNGMGKTHQMEVTDSDSSSDEDVEGKKYFIYSSMPNSPEKGGDETYATYNG